MESSSNSSGRIISYLQWNITLVQDKCFGKPTF
jgi:hypothetical protein